MRLLNAAIGDVRSLAFSPDSDALAATVVKQGVFLWNLGSTGGPVHLDDDDKLRHGTLSFAPDGRSLAWAGSNAWNIYDRDERDLARKSLDHRGLLIAVHRTPDGSRIVSEHTFPSSTLTGWSVTDEGWNQDWTISTKDYFIRRYAVDPCEQRVAVICQPNGSAVRLELRSAVSGVIQNSGPCPYDEVEQLLFSPDGTQIVAVRHMTLVVWSVPELGKPHLVRDSSRKDAGRKGVSRTHFTSLAFHPSGRYLFASSNDETVHVFDTVSWDCISRFSWKLGQMRSVGVSADGALAAAGNDKGEVIVWDVDL